MNDSEFDCIITVTRRIDPVSQAKFAATPSWKAAWYVDRSPYEKTLLLWPGQTVCDNITTLWSYLEDSDILLVSEGRYPQFSSTFAYKKGDNFPQLMKSMSIYLPLASQPAALSHSLTITPAVRAAVLPHNWMFSYTRLPGSSLNSLHHTLVMKDVVYISKVASRSAAAAASHCNWINSKPFEARMFTWDADKKKTNKLSTKEACDVALAGRCNNSREIRWAGPKWQQPMPLQDYRAHIEVGDGAQLAPSPLPLADRLKGLSHGVVYFGYSLTPARVKRYVEEIEVAAWGVKRHNPDLNIALLTNDRSFTLRPPFSHVIYIADEDITLTGSRDGSSWNLYTRTLYLHQSPFDLSVQIDSDRIVCTDLTPLFEMLLEYDFIGNSGGVLPTMDNGVMGWRKGPKWNALHEAWCKKMKEMKMEDIDDQEPLTRVRYSVPGLKMGITNPTWQLRYAPALRGDRKKSEITHTLLMKGPVHIYSAAGGTLIEEQDGICHWANAEADRPRVFVNDRKKGGFQIVFSAEECDATTGQRGMCNHPELDWSKPYPEVMPVDEYLKRYDVPMRKG